MSNYDLRAREWDQRMKDTDTTQGEPIAPDPFKTVAYLDSIYPPVMVGHFWGKEKLLELAAYYFINDLPFPPRMRSDFVRFHVTPEQFEARTYVMLLTVDIEFGLPKEANRPEVIELANRWKAKPSEPMTMETLKNSKHIQVMDKRTYLQIYDIPLVPVFRDRPHAQP